MNSWKALKAPGPGMYDTFRAVWSRKVSRKSTSSNEVGSFQYCAAPGSPYPKNKSWNQSGTTVSSEFIKLLMISGVIRMKTLQTIFLDSLRGWYFFLTLYLQMYLIDVVLAPDGGHKHVEERDSDSEVHADRRLVDWGVHAAANAAVRWLEASEEGGAPKGHKEAVVRASAHDTHRCEAFTGRPLRIIKTKYSSMWLDQRSQEMKELLQAGILPSEEDMKKLHSILKPTAKAAGKVSCVGKCEPTVCLCKTTAKPKAVQAHSKIDT